MSITIEGPMRRMISVSGGAQSNSMVILAVGFLLVLGQVVAGEAAPVGDFGLLRLVARGHRANLARIVTWKGRASISTTRVTPRRDDVTRSSVDFAYRRFPLAKRWNWSYIEIRRITDGQDKSPQPFKRNVMVKDGVWFRLTDFGPSVVRALLVKPAASERIRNGSDDFDPTYCFTYGGMAMDEYLLHLADVADRHPEGPKRLTRDGELVTYRSTATNETGRCSWRLVFDLSKGCNLMVCDVDAPTYKSIRTYEYEYRGGVFVPTRVKWRFKSPKKKQRKDIVFENQVVNEALDEREFSPDALGVRAGDHVQDKVLGTTYTYGEPNLRELAQ